MNAELPTQEATSAELIERVAHVMREDGRCQPLRGLHLFRVSGPTEPVHGVTELSFCVIVQGSKEIFLGDRRYRYDPAHYLLATVELPIVGQIVEASPARPYLSVRLHLDPALVSSVIVEAGVDASDDQVDESAVAVSGLTPHLLDAVLRLLRLMDTPAESAFMLPLITREIVYRLLLGEQGARLRHITALNGQSLTIAKAVEWLRKDFNQPLRIDDIARELGMSVSGFHHHFKAVTAMSPLQYQKRMRLQEARRLMLSGLLDATRVAYQVGYDDASHFTREYKRLFGLPPMRDVERLRTAMHVSNNAMAG